jgi:hypothetical protein
MYSLYFQNAPSCVAGIQPPKRRLGYRVGAMSLSVPPCLVIKAQPRSISSLRLLIVPTSNPELRHSQPVQYNYPESNSLPAEPCPRKPINKVRRLQSTGKPQLHSHTATHRHLYSRLRNNIIRPLSTEFILTVHAGSTSPAPSASSGSWRSLKSNMS